jgi:hypothetical protein
MKKTKILSIAVAAATLFSTSNVFAESCQDAYNNCMGEPIHNQNICYAAFQTCNAGESLS